MTTAHFTNYDFSRRTVSQTAVTNQKLSSALAEEMHQRKFALVRVLNKIQRELGYISTASAVFMVAFPSELIQCENRHLPFAILIDYHAKKTFHYQE